MGVIIIDTILAMVLGYVNYKIGWYPGMLCVAESFVLTGLCLIYFKWLDRHKCEFLPMTYFSISIVILITNIFWTVIIFIVARLIGG